MRKRRSVLLDIGLRRRRIVPYLVILSDVSSDAVYAAESKDPTVLGCGGGH